MKKAHKIIDYCMVNFTNDKIVTSIKSKEWIVSTLVIASSIVMFNYGSIEVPIEGFFLIYLLFNLTAVFGLFDFAMMMYWKKVIRGLSWRESFNGTTFFHLTIYVMLLLVGQSLLSVK